MARKPQPTRLKILHGNPGKRPLNDREPQFERGIPRCPDHLDDKAKKEWEFITKHLHGVGMLCKVDKAALAAYCSSYSRWAQAEETVAKTGPLLKSDVVSAKTGAVIRSHFYANPMLRVARDAKRDMHAFLTEFGLTPSSRSKLSVPGVTETEDDFERPDNPVAGKVGG